MKASSKASANGWQMRNIRAPRSSMASLSCYSSPGLSSLCFLLHKKKIHSLLQSFPPVNTFLLMHSFYFLNILSSRGRSWAVGAPKPFNSGPKEPVPLPYWEKQIFLYVCHYVEQVRQLCITDLSLTRTLSHLAITCDSLSHHIDETMLVFRPTIDVQCPYKGLLSPLLGVPCAPASIESLLYCCLHQSAMLRRAPHPVALTCF